MAFKIRRGEDIGIPVNITYENKRPYDLTDWTKITAEFKCADGEIASKSTDPVGGVQATIEYETVNYTAVNEGILGNTIALVFDGSDDIATVVGDWNAGNPTNTVEHDAADDSVVPTGATATLADGVDPLPEIDIISEVLGEINIKLSDVDTNKLRLGQDQSIKLMIDFEDHPEGNRRIAVVNRMIDVEEVLL